MTPPRELLRLVIATAIPGEVGTLVGTAAVREGREARMKAREKYISSRTIEGLVDAHLWSTMSLERYRGPFWGFYNVWAF